MSITRESIYREALETIVRELTRRGSCELCDMGAPDHHPSCVGGTAEEALAFAPLVGTKGAP